MVKPKFDPSGNPVDRRMAQDHAAGRRRTATSAGGYASGPQFGDVLPGNKPTTLDELYAEDYARMSDAELKAKYERATLATTEALGTDRFMTRMSEENRLRRALMERGISIF